MKLHKNKKMFEALSQVVSEWRNIPLDAVKRDYLIVLILQQLSKSEFVESCVFKGGTSLSKCYPGTIERFSEDIDLTFLNTELKEKQKDKALKKIENVLWSEFSHEKLSDERSKISKSSLIWLDEIGADYRIKLEIGSTIRPEPSHKMALQTYIQDYLEENNKLDDIKEFDLEPVEVNVLDITRTFLDKVLAVKRHAFNQDLARKVRHIYDVVQLFENTEIQSFLANDSKLRDLFNITKQTDSFYIRKRKNQREDYNPDTPFDFDLWRTMFDEKAVRQNYETLHQELLYTNKPQNFDKAIIIFEMIDRLLRKVEQNPHNHL